MELKEDRRPYYVSKVVNCGQKLLWFKSWYLELKAKFCGAKVGTWGQKLRNNVQNLVLEVKS